MVLTRWVSILVSSLLINPTNSLPREFFPINSQLPPVARISQPFSFTFSPSTFSSPFPITYSLVDAPRWLSLDSSSRRFHGTPSDQDVPSGDVVGLKFGLVAQDREGLITSNVTFVVSRRPSPVVGIPLEQQLSRLGSVSAPSSLLLRPGASFRYGFERDTFTVEGGSALAYYAVSADNTPLPAWVIFDPRNISFSGVAPGVDSLVQPPQVFDLQLVASDTEGFSSASIPFSIVVGSHQLTADSARVRLDVQRGVPFEYTELARTIKLDGRPLTPQNTSSIRATNLPGWLSFDATSWELKGLPDASAESANVTVSVADTFGGRLNLTLSLQVRTAGTTAAPSSSGGSPAPTSSIDSQPSAGDPNSAPNLVLIFILVPVLLVCIIGTTLLFYFRGRRRPANDEVGIKPGELPPQDSDGPDACQPEHKYCNAGGANTPATMVRPAAAYRARGRRSPAEGQDPASTPSGDVDALQPKGRRSWVLSRQISKSWRKGSPDNLLEAYNHRSTHKLPAERAARAEDSSPELSQLRTAGDAVRWPTIMHIPAGRDQPRQPTLPVNTPKSSVETFETTSTLRPARTYDADIDASPAPSSVDNPESIGTLSQANWSPRNDESFSNRGYMNQQEAVYCDVSSSGEDSDNVSRHPSTHSKTTKSENLRPGMPRLRHKHQELSRDQRTRLSLLRERQALDDFRALMSKAPTPPTESASRAPETASPAVPPRSARRSVLAEPEDPWDSTPPVRKLQKIRRSMYEDY